MRNWMGSSFSERFLLFFLPLAHGIFMGGPQAFRRNQAFFPGPDEIFPVASAQGFPDQGEILRTAELQECPLHGLFMGIPGNIDVLAGSGIHAGIEHAGG